MDLMSRFGSMHALCLLTIVVSLVFGGATRSGYLGDVIVQLTAIPLLVCALGGLLSSERAREHRATMLLAFSIVLVPLLQLIPLPPDVWSRLPGREALVATFAAIEQPLPWLPLSMTPHATWFGAMSLLPPLAIFLGVAQLGSEKRRQLILVMIAVGSLTMILGLAQVAQGPDSPLRPFSRETEAVGLFANRNHFAALIYCLFLFTIVIAARSAEVGRETLKLGTGLMPLVIGLVLAALMIGAQLMARSRGGLALMLLAVVGGGLLVSGMAKAAGRNSTTVRLLIGAVATTVLLGAQYPVVRILERLTSDPLADGRLSFARNTWTAIQDTLPVGSGIGSFVWVYPGYEKISDLRETYANRAHNDILELVLEAGVIGMALMAAFLVWLVIRSLAVWRTPAAVPSTLDIGLARAATMLIVLLIAHSTVDYPLRTGAMVAVFALACGLLIPPLGRDSDNVATQDTGERGQDTPRSRHRRRRTADQTVTGASPPGPGVAPSSTPVWSAPPKQQLPPIEWPKDPDIWTAKPERPKHNLDDFEWPDELKKKN